VCAGAFAVVALAGPRLPASGSLLAIAAVAAAFGLFWPVMADVVRDGPGDFHRRWFEAGEATIRLGMTVDELAVVMLGLVTAVSLAVQVYSLGYMRGDPRISWYYAVHSLFAASMLTLVLANNLLVLYIGWELVGLCSYLLIGFWQERRPAAEAAKKAFITTRVGDVALMIGFLVLFRAGGTFELSELFAKVQEGEIGATSLNLAMTLIFIGAAGKSAQFPLHVWLPDAMEGPTPVSALIHAATMVAAGVYLVARLAPLYVLTPDVLVLVSAIGLTTALLGAVLALVQNDIKKVLAYSTISQLGLMMLSLGSFGFAAGIFHLLTHGFFKALLFLGAGNIAKATHEEQDIRRMGGLRTRLPGTFTTFLMAGLALAGLFPLSGFFSKDEVLTAVLDGRGRAWYAAGLVVSVLTALYVARMVTLAFMGRPRSAAAEHASEEGRELPATMTVPMTGLLVPAAGLGLLAIPWRAFEGFASFVVFRPLPVHAFELRHEVFWPSLLVVVAALLAGWALYYRAEGLPRSAVQARLPRLYQVMENKFYLDHLYQWTVDHVVLAFSRLVALFDRRVVSDMGVDAPGRATVWGSFVLRYHETGLVSAYALTIAVTAVVVVLIVIAT
jgi:NADH-quinone oxidoreductase subunit L